KAHGSDLGATAAIAGRTAYEPGGGSATWPKASRQCREGRWRGPVRPVSQIAARGGRGHRGSLGAVTYPARAARPRHRVDARGGAEPTGRLAGATSNAT